METSPIVDSIRLSDLVEELCAKPRLPGSPGHRAARESIAARFEAAGLSATIESRTTDGATCLNVFARPRAPRADRPLVIVGAHYDTAPDTPGADDNASAVAALLELARHVGSRPHQAASHLELVAYDLEEYGFGGSRLHARELAARNRSVLLMISLEMLGFTAPGQELPPLIAGRRAVGDFIGLVANDRSAKPFALVESAFREDPALPVESLVLPGTGDAFPEARLSDHSSFWDRGFPAMMVTDTSFLRNPHYHTPSDRPDTLDYPFLARVTAGVSRAVDALLAAT